MLISGGVVPVSYCCVQGGWSGEGNIDEDPLFVGQSVHLSVNSPCIDHGDTNALYNDPEDTGHPGYALWPSMGGLRNDMGAYGGPGSAVLGTTPDVKEAVGTGRLHPVALLENHPNPFQGETTIRYQLRNPEGNGEVSLRIYDVCGRIVRMFPGNPHDEGIQSIVWDGRDGRGEPAGTGVYIYHLETSDFSLSKRLILSR
jgi:hypothetical protein